MWCFVYFSISLDLTAFGHHISALMSVLIRGASEKNFLFLKLGLFHRMPILIFPLATVRIWCEGSLRSGCFQSSQIFCILVIWTFSILVFKAFLIYIFIKALWNLHSCSKVPSFLFLGIWCVSTSSTNWILHYHS